MPNRGNVFGWIDAAVFVHQTVELTVVQHRFQVFEITSFAIIEGACYIGIGWLFLLYGYYRGIGKPGMSVMLTIASLGTRVLLSYSLAYHLGVTIIWWSIPIGWFLADIIGMSYGFYKEKWRIS